MVSRSGAQVACILGFMTVFGCALPIAELALGVKFHNNADNECANGTLLQPTTWLIVGGAVSLSVFVILLPMLIITTLTESKVGGLFVILFTVLGGCFDLAWAIIGAVILWRDNLHCDPSPLHDIMYASVILRLIGLLQHIKSKGE